jgi:dTDP-glucose pyrophosphorylase
MAVERALVLARGMGTRMRAADGSARLTPEQQRAADAGLKAMMPIGGRPFLDYILAGLADAGIRDAALVVAPAHDAVKERYTDAAAPSRIRVSFVVQPEPLGTADAVLAGRQWAGDAPFLAMNADNLYPSPVLRDLAALREPGLPVFERGDLARTSNIPAGRFAAFALLDVGADGYLRRITEKPAPAAIERAGDSALVSMNCWHFDSRIFDACRDVPKSARGEFELPEAVNLALTRGVPFKAVPARGPVLDLSTRADAAEVARRLAAHDVRL